MSVEREQTNLKAGKCAEVAIVCKTIPHYRKRFYELLRTDLDRKGVRLRVIYGEPSLVDALKRDTVDLAWGEKTRTRIFRLLGRELYFQPCIRMTRSADLVIVEQATKLLVNYVFLVRQLRRRQKVCLWGHGRNFQVHDASWMGEFIKAKYSRHVHWWFAYNELSAIAVRSLGFPEERITLVQNSVDTKGLTEAAKQISDEVVEDLLRTYGLKGENIGLFVGGLYPDKRLGFLFEAADIVRRNIPDFELIIVGAGPDEGLVRDMCQQRSFVHHVGPMFEEGKLAFFSISKLLMMPGLVGLVVLDSFALSVPLVTTDVPFHSPEIAYLKDGENGIIVKDSESPEAYARCIIELLNSPERLAALRGGCKQALAEFSIEAMVSNFAAGILDALSVHTPPLRSMKSP